MFLLKFYQALVVGPGAKLEVTYLLIKGKPGHVNLNICSLLLWTTPDIPNVISSSHNLLHIDMLHHVKIEKSKIASSNLACT